MEGEVVLSGVSAFSLTFPKSASLDPNKFGGRSCLSRRLEHFGQNLSKLRGSRIFRNFSNTEKKTSPSKLLAFGLRWSKNRCSQVVKSYCRLTLLLDLKAHILEGEVVSSRCAMINSYFGSGMKETISPVANTLQPRKS